MITPASLNLRRRPRWLTTALLRRGGDGIALAAATVAGLLVGGLLEGARAVVEDTSLLTAHAAVWLAGLALLRWLWPRGSLNLGRVLSGSALGLVAAIAILLSLVAATSLDASPASIAVSVALAVPAVAVRRRLWPVEEAFAPVEDRRARRHEEALSIVFHELRRPLSTLVSASELALDTDIPEEERAQLLQNLHRQALRLNDFLEEILEAARIQSGRLRLNLFPIDLRKLAREACEEFFDAHGSHELRLLLGRQKMPVAADPAKLRMVLSNLLANAVAYSPHGSVITVRAFRGGDSVGLLVEDEGPGVPEPYRQQIFEQFFRIPGTSERGFGLGLYIARQLMQAHGGAISVDGRTPRGSRFAIELPMLEMANRGASFSRERGAFSPTSHRPRQAGQGSKGRLSRAGKLGLPIEIPKR